MLVPGINETAAPATPNVAHPVDGTADSGSPTFTDALAAAKGAAHGDSSGNSAASAPAATSKPGTEPAKPDTQATNPTSTTVAGGSSGSSSSQPEIVSRYSKTTLTLTPGSVTPPNQKPGSGSSTVPADITATPTVLPAMPVSLPVPVPVAIPPAPDPVPVAVASTVPSVDANATSAQTTSTSDSNNWQGTGGPLSMTGAPPAKAGAAADANADPDAVAGADPVAAADAGTVAVADNDQPTNLSDSTGMPNQPQQVPGTDGTPANDVVQSPIALGAAPVQLTEPLNSQISAKPATQAHHLSAIQSGATVQDESQSASAAATAPQAQLDPADASAAANTTSAFAEQKHTFVAAALHAVSSSVASAIQAPFTAATTELPKSPVPATPAAPTPSIAASAGTSQTASGGGPGTGSNGQSSSGHGNAQSGSSSPQETFSNHAPADAPAPIQPADDTAATSAVRADVVAAQSNQTNVPVSMTSSENASATSELTGSLQTAASSASPSAPTDGAALPDAQVSQAHLFGGPGAAEMRISVNTDALGPIELRATSDKDRIGAVIAAAKPETQELLNNELPTLHQALSERNLQIQQLTVSHGSLAGGMSGRGYSQSSDAWQKQAAGNYWQPSTESASTTEDLPAAVVSVAVPGKLSVHA